MSSIIYPVVIAQGHIMLAKHEDLLKNCKKGSHLAKHARYYDRNIDFENVKVITGHEKHIEF